VAAGEHCMPGTMQWACVGSSCPSNRAIRSSLSQSIQSYA
jgi:hypothetical protein